MTHECGRRGTNIHEEPLPASTTTVWHDAIEPCCTRPIITRVHLAAADVLHRHISFHTTEVCVFVIRDIIRFFSVLRWQGVIKDVQPGVTLYFFLSTNPMKRFVSTACSQCTLGFSVKCYKLQLIPQVWEARSCWNKQRLHWKTIRLGPHVAPSPSITEGFIWHERGHRHVFPCSLQSIVSLTVFTERRSFLIKDAMDLLPVNCETSCNFFSFSETSWQQIHTFSWNKKGSANMLLLACYSHELDCGWITVSRTRKHVPSLPARSRLHGYGLTQPSCGC